MEKGFYLAGEMLLLTFVATWSLH